MHDDVCLYIYIPEYRHAYLHHEVPIQAYLEPRMHVSHTLPLNDGACVKTWREISAQLYARRSPLYSANQQVWWTLYAHHELKNKGTEFLAPNGFPAFPLEVGEEILEDHPMIQSAFQPTATARQELLFWFLENEGSLRLCLHVLKE